MSTSMKTFRIIFVSIIAFLGACCIANANEKPKRTISTETNKKVISDYKKLTVPMQTLIITGGRRPKTYTC